MEFDMKRLVLASALAMSVAAPALADGVNTLNASTMSQASGMTADILRNAARSSDDGIDRLFADDIAAPGEVAKPVNARAARILKEGALASDDGIDRLSAGKKYGTSFTGEPVSARIKAILNPPSINRDGENS
ncbi:hypothetical protein RGUI_3253 [Rhodovulum sp. P5]|uniref:hypothetical protein n=1 Tax=Rhodovulum sp. P5 TaxID=1564506 RepID=UPI0009C21BBA|nr:hypothetical protein [Rhodovulum sp. P5]ARE41394.1 hypothetical protein RGUI_3253 [Rhodovulum sp. P5]